MPQQDQDGLNAFLGRMLGELGAIAIGALVVLGYRLGFYQAMRTGEPVNAAELARRTGTHERYVREWVATGYVDYDFGADRFSLNPEQATVFADENSPASKAGAFEALSTLWLDEPKLEEAVGSGDNANLVSSWLPTLDGVAEKLERDGAAADVGCGHDASTIVMERAFPHSRFIGFDHHPASIERARTAAQEVGLGLGAQAGELRLRQVVTAGGFSRFRRAAETPFNLVLEARP